MVQQRCHLTFYHISLVYRAFIVKKRACSVYELHASYEQLPPHIYLCASAQLYRRRSSYFYTLNTNNGARDRPTNCALSATYKIIRRRHKQNASRIRVHCSVFHVFHLTTCALTHGKRIYFYKKKKLNHSSCRALSHSFISENQKKSADIIIRCRKYEYMCITRSASANIINNIEFSKIWEA